jgi:uroporphyrinogen decarboxylase
VEPLLVRAARREAVERTPVWFMRQAGRSLPEYRAIRERHAFFEVNRSAELTAEVTLQPVRRHNVDAAVMFADIMTPVVAMGLDVELVEGVGPVVREPVRSLAAVERLRVPDPEETLAPILEAIGIVRRELAPEQAVVGFFGGPFTVAGYLVEGKPSREFAVTKTLMYAEPEVWRALLDKLADTFAAYAVAQAHAGADVVQLFDSWVGNLSPADYAEFVAPWSGRVLDALRDAGVPTIHFGTGTATLLAEMAATGGDVIGLDWRIPLNAGWSAVGEKAVQGNLDPAVLLGPWERIEAAVRDVLARAGGRPGHIFNLGHGVLPRTDPDVIGRVRELVHAETSVAARRPSGAPV